MRAASACACGSSSPTWTDLLARFGVELQIRRRNTGEVPRHGAWR
jgi:hypothetical protein